MADTNRKAQKRSFIQISSSSEEESSEDDYVIQDVTSSPSSEEEDDESEWNESDDECYSDDKDDVDNLDDDDESMCTRVSHRLREQSDLVDLSLNNCKEYLRKNGLRLSGTKLECISRIEEHCRLKDGNAEALYPRSSFTIDCTGDVCKGDVVLFTQKVYKNFDKVTRSGGILGKRTIAGRIVKESYGAAKQQHTFTVEVLWSKGVKTLPPLFPLLVKGRNLYRLKTFRQRWENERERFQVLDEKHKRGAEARSVRATRKVEAAKRINAKASRKKGGDKRQKHSREQRQHQKTEFGKENHVNVRASRGKRSSMNYREKPQDVRHSNSKRTREPIVSTSRRHQPSTHPNHFRESSFQSYPYPPPNFYHAPPEMHSFRASNRFPPILHSAQFSSYSAPYGMPIEHHEVTGVSHQHGAPSNFAFGAQSRNFNYFPNREREAAARWW